MVTGERVSEAGAELDAESERIARLEARVAELERQEKGYSGVSIVCFSGEWDRLFAAFTIANGALATGLDVHLFFTFWASSALRNPKSQTRKKGMSDRIVGWMLPKQAEDTPLSRLHFGGLGKWFLRRLIKRKGIEDLDALIASARELGAHFHLCEMSFGLFGLEEQELIDCNGLDCCGVATFLAEVRRGHMVLFI